VKTNFNLSQKLDAVHFSPGQLVAKPSIAVPLRPRVRRPTMSEPHHDGAATVEGLC